MCSRCGERYEISRARATSPLCRACRFPHNGDVTEYERQDELLVAVAAMR